MEGGDEPARRGALLPPGEHGSRRQGDPCYGLAWKVAVALTVDGPTVTTQVLPAPQSVVSSREQSIPAGSEVTEPFPTPSALTR